MSKQKFEKGDLVYHEPSDSLFIIWQVTNWSDFVYVEGWFYYGVILFETKNLTLISKSEFK